VVFSASRSGSRPARAGVVDIGSNSIRLVAFDVRARITLPLFNEKAICRLGATLPETGELSPERVEVALASLRRFRLLADGLGLDALYVLATSAVRDAANGRAFVAAAEAIFEVPVMVLSGQEEARFAARGALAGLPDADGVAGDLGGGSLELAALAEGGVGEAVSLPLGPLRRPRDADDARARKDVERQLAGIAWLDDLAGRTFVAVGGAWRALAHVQMARSGHPLRMIHGYGLLRADAESLVRQVVRSAPAALGRLPGVARQRAPSLPYAALLLGEILARGKPGEVCFSAYGLREGYLHTRLDLLDGEDPLDAAIDWLTRSSEVAALLLEHLMAWTAPLFAGESGSQRRLRRAACRLSNLAWHEHPDYRGRQAFEAVLRGAVLPVRHVERGFLALALLHRYGSRQAPEANAIERLLPLQLARRARVLGLALRLAYRVSAGADPLLGSARLEVDGGALRLRLPPELDAGDALARDLQSLARAADLEALGTAA